MKLQLYIVLFLMISQCVCVAQSINVINPSSAGQGDNLNIDISGQLTNFDMASTTVWFDQGSSTVIYANSVNVISQIFLGADFTFNYSHPTGFYNVNIYDDLDGWIVEPNGFYLYAGTNPPQIILVAPDSAIQGQSLSVDIGGQNTNFGMGTTTTPVWFTQGTSTIYANSVLLNTLTSLTASFSIPFNAGVGYWDVSVWSPLDGVVTMGSGFYIDWDPNGIEINKAEFSVLVNVYPNPASDFIYVKSEENIEYISISNRVGQLIYSVTCNGNYVRLGLGDRDLNGIYLLTIKTKKGLQVKKIAFY